MLTVTADHQTRAYGRRESAVDGALPAGSLKWGHRGEPDPRRHDDTANRRRAPWYLFDYGERRGQARRGVPIHEPAVAHRQRRIRGAVCLVWWSAVTVSIAGVTVSVPLT